MEKCYLILAITHYYIWCRSYHMIYSLLLRYKTAKGSSTGLFRVGPTKFKAAKSYLYNDQITTPNIDSHKHQTHQLVV